MSENEKPPNGNVPTENGAPAESDQSQDKHEKDNGGGGEKKDDKQEEKQPAGGFDATPIPSAPPGFTLKFTIHRATNLPIADLNTLSSDPYVLAQIDTSVSTRHKEDPKLRFRTPTVRKNTEPVWDEEWIVANIPASGFKLKLRVYDEDPSDQDDRLGNVHVTIPSLSESWAGIKNQSYEIHKRSGSIRAYAVRSMAVCFGKAKHMTGDMFLSIEMLGRTEPDGQNGRLYTVGPCRWVRHYSPMLGRLTGTKEPDDEDQQNQEATAGKRKTSMQQYNFQANQVQLEGPVPAELYHRFVEFKPWVKSMFSGTGLRGVILGKALHHQHSRVYNFDRTTEWGHYPQGPCHDMTKKFLDLVHYDKGGRIFTYVLTLDALWRFTETGKEFGIDMLSKHTMHSDVSIYIAFSGEFFIRRLRHKNRPPPPDPAGETSQTHPPDHQSNEFENVQYNDDDEPPTDPARYELVIDNDSGTYRPNAAKLPLLKRFLAHSLPGLHIQTLDCQADSEKMDKMKNEQRERKKASGGKIVYTQGDGDDSSISSSDEEDLDRIEAGGVERDYTQGGALSQAAKDQKRRQQAKWSKAQRKFGGSGRRANAAGDGEQGGEEVEASAPTAAQA